MSIAVLKTQINHLCSQLKISANLKTFKANTNPPPSEEVKQDLSQSTPSKQQNIDSSASKSQAAIKSTTITISSSTYQLI